MRRANKKWKMKWKENKRMQKYDWKCEKDMMEVM